jgi:hypothetical protein
VPALALIWRDRRPVEVLGLAVAGVVGWAALGQIDAAALVPVMFALFQRRNYQASEVTLRIARRFRADEISAQRCALILVDYLVSEDAPNGPIGMGQRLASLKVRCQSRGCGSNGVSRAIMPGVMAWRESCRSDRDTGAGAGLAWR